MNSYTAPGILETDHILRPFAKERAFVDEAVQAAMLRTNYNSITTYKDLVIKTCEVLQLEVQDVVGRSRARAHVDARHLIMWLMCKAPERLTYGQIGKLLNRDHATVLHAKRKVDNLLETSPSFRVKFNVFMLGAKEIGFPVI